MNLILPLAFAAMAFAALLLPTAADRLRGGLGLPAFALGAASIPFLADIRGPELTLWVSAALLLLGPALLLLATWRARLNWRKPAVPLVFASTAAALFAAWPILRVGGVVPAVLTTGALAFSGLFLWMLGERIGVGRAVRWLDARLPATHGKARRVPSSSWAGRSSWHWRGSPRPFWSWSSGNRSALGVGVVVSWWTVATRRAPVAFAAASFATAFTAPETALGAWLLLGWAALLDRTHPRITAVAGSAGGYLGVRALLSGEVLYTVLLVGAATALLGALAAAPSAESSASR